jgi:purine nucleosidase
MTKRIILDTDIGDDIDDAFALALAIASPELELVGVTTVHGPVEKRARIARKLLNWAGKAEIPVIPGFAGCGAPDREPNQAGWATGTGLQPPAQGAVDCLLQAIADAPGEITVVAIGPLSNVAKCLEEEPAIGVKMAELIVMGGSVRRGYAGAPEPVAEYNIACDVEAAIRVLDSGARLTVVPLDATGTLMLPDRYLGLLRESTGPLARALTELLPRWQAEGRMRPVLHDPLAVGVAFNRGLGRFDPMRLEVTGDGLTVAIAGGAPNASVCVEADAEALFALVAGRISAYMGGSAPHSAV